MSELEDKKQQLTELEATIQEKHKYMQRLNANNEEFKRTIGKDSNAILFSLKVADQIYNNMIMERDVLLKEIERLDPTSKSVVAEEVEVMVVEVPTGVHAENIPIEDVPEVLNEEEAIEKGLEKMAADSFIKKDFKELAEEFHRVCTPCKCEDLLRTISLNSGVMCEYLKSILDTLTSGVVYTGTVEEKNGNEKEE